MRSLRPFSLVFVLGAIAAGGAGAQRPSAAADRPAKPGENYVESWNDLRLEMVWIPGGTFKMGSHLSPEEVAQRFGGPVDDFRKEHPLHAVTLDGFWIGKCELSNAQYRRKQPKHDSGSHEQYTLNDDNQPVCHVTWEEASAYCDWLAEGTGRRYRLPSEAQWEYACRGGTDTVRFWGDGDAEMGQYANVLDKTAETVFAAAIRGRKDAPKGYDPFIPTNDGYKVAAPIGSFKPNGFGLHDTLGNVIEYCLDWHDPEYYGRSPLRNPVNETPSEYRVSRGGSWLHPSFRVRGADRGHIPMSHRSARVGLRVCRVVEPGEG